jgi:hypothetical protein
VAALEARAAADAVAMKGKKTDGVEESGGGAI